MVRLREYLDVDVVEAARERIAHIFDIFDTIVVMFSGGKDSLAALHLVHDEAKSRGIDHVNVVFRDEELIPQAVIDFVDEYRRRSWVKMLWFAVPLHSTKYVLGQVRDYVQWDPTRRWVRQPPAHAITLKPDDPRVFDQYSMDAETATYFKGSLAFVTGIRASESLIRYRSCVNKLNESYIVKAQSPLTGTTTAANVRLVRPVYDWEENDVFKYFMEEGIRYCPFYDAQLWAGSGLRVSTPLHQEAAKRFDLMKTFMPELYEQVIDVFPEMLAHERYYRDLDKKAVHAKYGDSFDGVRRWINENLEGGQRKMALARLAKVITRARRTPESYPPMYVLKAMMAGSYKREILPNAV